MCCPAVGQRQTREHEARTASSDRRRRRVSCTARSQVAVYIAAVRSVSQDPTARMHTVVKVYTVKSEIKRKIKFGADCIYDKEGCHHDEDNKVNQDSRERERERVVREYKRERERREKSASRAGASSRVCF